MVNYVVPAFLRKDYDEEKSTRRDVVKVVVPLSLPTGGTDLLRRFNSLAWKETDFAIVISELTRLTTISELAKALDSVISNGRSEAEVWAVYLNWLIEKSKGMFVTDRPAQRLLRRQLARLSDEHRAEILETLASVFAVGE